MRECTPSFSGVPWTSCCFVKAAKCMQTDAGSCQEALLCRSCLHSMSDLQHSNGPNWLWIISLKAQPQFWVAQSWQLPQWNQRSCLTGCIRFQSLINLSWYCNDMKSASNQKSLLHELLHLISPSGGSNSPTNLRQSNEPWVVSRKLQHAAMASSEGEAEEIREAYAGYWVPHSKVSKVSNAVGCWKDVWKSWNTWKSGVTMFMKSYVVYGYMEAGSSRVHEITE